MIKRKVSIHPDVKVDPFIKDYSELLRQHKLSNMDFWAIMSTTADLKEGPSYNDMLTYQQRPKNELMKLHTRKLPSKE